MGVAAGSGAAAEEEDRWLDLGWNHQATGVKGTARLQVMTLNQPGSLAYTFTASLVSRASANSRSTSESYTTCSYTALRVSMSMLSR